jgi:hypothetical protein
MHGNLKSMLARLHVQNYIAFLSLVEEKEPHVNFVNPCNAKRLDHPPMAMASLNRIQNDTLCDRSLELLLDISHIMFQVLC